MMIELDFLVLKDIRCAGARGCCLGLGVLMGSGKIKWIRVPRVRVNYRYM